MIGASRPSLTKPLALTALVAGATFLGYTLLQGKSNRETQRMVAEQPLRIKQEADSMENERFARLEQEILSHIKPNEQLITDSMYVACVKTACLPPVYLARLGASIPVRKAGMKRDSIEAVRNDSLRAIQEKEQRARDVEQKKTDESMKQAKARADSLVQAHKIALESIEKNLGVALKADNMLAAQPYLATLNKEASDSALANKWKSAFAFLSDSALGAAFDKAENPSEQYNENPMTRMRAARLYVQTYPRGDRAPYAAKLFLKGKQEALLKSLAGNPAPLTVIAPVQTYVQDILLAKKTGIDIAPYVSPLSARLSELAKNAPVWYPAPVHSQEQLEKDLIGVSAHVDSLIPRFSKENEARRSAAIGPGSEGTYLGLYKMPSYAALIVRFPGKKFDWKQSNIDSRREDVYFLDITRRYGPDVALFDIAEISFKGGMDAGKQLDFEELYRRFTNAIGPLGSAGNASATPVKAVKP